MVVYGVITTKGSPRDQEVTGKAVLKGQIHWKKIEHSVPFTFNPVNASSPSLSTIHHLAAKALIKDWQDEGQSKEDTVKLSVESSVISSHTAFIAVDEESSEPIAGAMKTWDIQARLGYDSLSICSSFSESDDEFDEDLDKEVPQINSKLIAEHKPRKEIMKSSTLIPEGPLVHSATVSVTSNTLNVIIAAQQADGSWKLDDTSMKAVDKSQKVIKDACPIKCKDNIAAVWATVLILTLLRKKYSSQQDEWELIAMKAESWMKKQALPSGVTIQVLYTAADILV